MKRLALLVALVAAGSVRLQSQSYSADADALAVRFESLVAQMSASQQARSAESIAVLRNNIRVIKSRAATLEGLRTKIADAKHRLRVAQQDAATAEAASERARTAVESRVSNFIQQRDHFVREFGDFFESWGLPRGGGERTAVSEEERVRFDAAQAPYLQRQEGFRVRADEIRDEQARAQALESVTTRKIEAVTRAVAEVSRLENSQQTLGEEFEEILTRNTGSVSKVAGLTPFPQNSVRLRPPTRVVTRPGTNTNALEQLHAQGSRDTNNCFDSSCMAVPVPRDGGPAEPAAVPSKVESHPAYRKATQAVADAERQSQEADARLRAAQRAGRPAEELQRITSEVTRLKGAELMEKFKLKSQVNEMSFGIDVSSRAPKSAGQ